MLPLPRARVGGRAQANQPGYFWYRTMVLHQRNATEELVRRLSAAAAGVRRDMKHRRRRGDAPAERLQMDLDTAIAEEDFAAAARLRDEIRALEPTFGTEQNAVTDVSFLLNDLEVRQKW